MTIHAHHPVIRRIHTYLLILIYFFLFLVIVIAAGLVQQRQKEPVGNAEATTLNSQVSPIQVWAPAFMGYGPLGSDPTTPEKDAQNFPIIIATDGKYKTHIQEMRAANPNVKILVYLNGSFKNTQDLGPNPDNSGVYPDSSFAKTDTGEYISPVAFPENKLMNPLDPLWQKSRSDKCKALIDNAGYDGCFFDTIGLAPVNAGYVTPGLPVNPSTGRTWTQQEWLQAVNIIMQAVKAENPGKLVYGNGLAHGNSYFGSPPTSQLFNSLDGAMAELFMRVPEQSLTTFKNEDDWKKDVDMIVDAENKNKTILLTTKAWIDGPLDLKNQWHKYALASYLLGGGPHTYFSFQYEHTTTSPTTFQIYWTTQLGTPLSPYQKIGTVYQREFSNGSVFVNPTSTSSTISLSENYYTIDGEILGNSLTLNAHTAEILIKIAASPTPTPTPTNTPTPIPPTPTNTPTPTFTPTPTPTNTPTPTPTPTNTPTPTPTATPTPTIPLSSIILVYAGGTQVDGVYPTMQLVINDVLVRTWTSVSFTADGSLRQFYYQHPKRLNKGDKIKVAFINDLYRRRTGEDRNLTVKGILVDNISYRSEDAFSKGSWDVLSGCREGYKNSQRLSCNGYFLYLIK